MLGSAADSGNTWSMMFRIVFCCAAALASIVADAATFAYITNELSNTVSVIDTATNTVVGVPIPTQCVPQM